jgi:hypothetical protein
MFTYAVFGAYIEQGKACLPSLLKLAQSEHTWVRFAVAESLLSGAVQWSRPIPKAIEAALRIASSLLDSGDENVVGRVAAYLADSFVARLDTRALSTTGRSLLMEFEAKRRQWEEQQP